MGATKDTGLDFAGVLKAAQKLPNEGPGKDLPDGFPFRTAPGHRVVNDQNAGIPGVVEYDYFIHRKVFLIYRPWWQCARCMNAIDAGAIVLPETGDHECPHTNIGTYKEIVDKILSGQLLFGSEQEVTQKDGSIVISLRWYEPKKTPKKPAAKNGEGP